MVSYEMVSVLIPALNEEASLEELYDRTAIALGSQPFEFIVIDDGSSDGTGDLLKRLRQQHSNISFISHYRTHGKSLALMQGFDAARGDVVITMDADLQDIPEMIPRFLEKIAEWYDMVNGWRANRHDVSSRRWVSRIFNRTTGRLFHCPVHDINCGFKAMTRRCYKRLKLRGDLHRLIPAIASSNGFRVTEIQIEHAERKYGTSRYRLLRYRGLLDIVALAAMGATQFRPFHVFCELAAAAWLMAVMSGLGWILCSLVSPCWISRLGSVCFGAAAIWGAFVGTLLPLFGTLLDVISGYFQNTAWRASLCKEKLSAGDE